MSDAAKQVIALFRHEKVLAEMQARHAGAGGQMEYFAENLETMVGPVNGLVVRVRGPGGEVKEADGVTGCQALASLLTAGGVGNMICAAVRSQVGSDPSAAVGQLAQVAARPGAHSVVPGHDFSAQTSHFPTPAPPATSYPAGTTVASSQADHSYPVGTVVNSASETHRYPSGTSISGGTMPMPTHQAPAPPPPFFPAQIGDVVPTQEAESVSAQEPPTNGLSLVYEQLGRLVASPDLKLRLQGPDTIKSEVRELLSVVQAP